MTIRWNPNAAEEIKKMVTRNIEGPARRAVESTVCPDHGKSPKLVRHGDGLRIENFCCKKVAEIAARNAGFGDVSWNV